MAKKIEEGGQPGFFKEDVPKEDKEKEKKPVDYASLGYDRMEVISALIKEMRLGKLEEALYWLKVMRQANEPKNYVVRRLVAFAGEDTWGQEGFRIASDMVTCFNWEPPYDWNIIEQALVMLTKCVKWWECEDGVAWKKAEMKNSELLKSDPLKRKIPMYALDEHTKRGWVLKDEGKMDNRMSGDGNGIAKRIDCFEKHGKFVWDDRYLRGWGKYVNDELDKEKGEWKANLKKKGGEADAKSEDVAPEAKTENGKKQTSPPSRPNGGKEGYEPRIEYDITTKNFRVQSEKDPDQFYEVNLIEGHCTCVHHEMRGAFCKHMQAAKNWTPF